MDSGFEADLLYLDFARAFDSVCRRRLLSEVKWFGIDGPLPRWFKSYISRFGRMQCFVLNGSSSILPVGISLNQVFLKGPYGGNPVTEIC